MMNIHGFGQPELVLGIPQRYGGNLPDEKPQSSSEHMAFGITTSASEAQKQHDAYESSTSPYRPPSAGSTGLMYPQMQPQSKAGGGISMQSQGSFNTFSGDVGFGGGFSTNVGAGPIEGDLTEEEMVLIRNAEEKRQARMLEVH
jgi:hypothetical protein